MQLKWNEVKNVADSRQIPVQYCIAGENYWIKAIDGTFEVECLIPLDELNDDTADFVANYKDAANKSPNQLVTTQAEKNDKVLKLACSIAEFDVDGNAEIIIKSPTGGRWVAGGYLFMQEWKPGDRITAVSVVDVDNILGYGAETVLKTYHDADVDSGNQGWLLWPNANGAAEVEIDPIGGYGFIPEGLYLEIYVTKASGNTSTNVMCNYWWAKNE